VVIDEFFARWGVLVIYNTAKVGTFFYIFQIFLQKNAILIGYFLNLK